MRAKETHKFPALVGMAFTYLFCRAISFAIFGMSIHRELKLDGAIGDFAELKTGHFTT